MKQAAILLLAIILLASCKYKKEEDPEAKFFPVVSFLKGQARDVDTGLYRIMKVETIDSNSVTTYLNRNQFQDAARDFLTLEDISSSKWSDDYEETKMFDEGLNQAMLDYTPKTNDAPISRETVVLEPTNANGNNDVSSIVITKDEEHGDSTVSKTMVWYVNKRFTVVSKIQKKNKPEVIRKLEVIWNDFSDQRNVEETK